MNTKKRIVKEELDQEMKTLVSRIRNENIALNKILNQLQSEEIAVGKTKEEPEKDTSIIRKSPSNK